MLLECLSRPMPPSCCGRAARGRRTLTSGDGLLEKVEDRLLLEFGGLGPDTPAACGPSGEIGRCRTVVVRRAGVGAGAQECVYRSRTTVPHCSMQRRNPASGSCVRVSARVNQIGDDRPLAGRIPVRGAGFADDRRVQRFGTAQTRSRARPTS